MKKFVFIFFIFWAGKLCAFHSFENKRIQSFVSDTKLERPNPFWALQKKKRNAGRKVLGTVLAFPLPFGVIGLHRIYLGTKPYVPLVYIGTLGGGFGILPFIDFCVLLLDKDTERYKDNSHIFMWIENQEKKQETKNTYD